MIATVSTVKDDPARLATWVARNRRAGVDLMVVFLDDDASAVGLQERVGTDRVVLVPASEWWRPKRPARLNVRQRINTGAGIWALEQAGISGWVFHIDSDEVLEVDKDRLLALDADVDAVRLAAPRSRGPMVLAR